MGLVVDGVLFTLTGKNLTADIGIGAVDALVEVNNFFIRVALDDIGVGAFKDIGKEPDEFFLLLGRTAPPVGAERAAGHFGEIEARIENLFQLITAFLCLSRRF